MTGNSKQIQWRSQLFVSRGAIGGPRCQSGGPRYQFVRLKTHHFGNFNRNIRKFINFRNTENLKWGSHWGGQRSEQGGPGPPRPHHGYATEQIQPSSEGAISPSCHRMLYNYLSCLDLILPVIQLSNVHFTLHCW